MNNNIASLRRKKGESQAVLAKYLGITRDALSSYERGLVIPSTDEALRIAYALDEPFEYVFTLEDHELPKRLSSPKAVNRHIYSRWDSFRFIDLFAGIGGIRLGFESVGGKCVFSSEFDEEACKTYVANFGEHPAGDITKINAHDIPDFDVLLAGFPCQAFSIIGKKEGFANETCGTLFFDIERILKAKRPPAFMLENVRNLVAHDGGNTFRVIQDHLQALGYRTHAKVLNALDYGVPQKRERIIIVGFLDDINFNFPLPVPISQRKTLEDVLEKTVDAKYYVRDRIRESRLRRLNQRDYPKPYISHENMAGSITPHPYSSALRAGASANYILINDERRPTEREMLRLQGFPEDFKIVVPYGQIKKQCGNSVAVPMIQAVASEMIKVLKENEQKEKTVNTRKKAS